MPDRSDRARVERTAPGREGERGDSVATPIPTAQGSSPAAKPRSIFRATTTHHHHSHRAPDLDAGRDDDADLGL
jgi:hypothetical protein